ncbi:hypothetical protein JCM10908_000459 [Rhodotorula pacifica]|uniref:uncharacterized protein n=1 Tax=Rhodotorula pacifica TaxID=1495444 RepID=UPI00317FEB20
MASSDTNDAGLITAPSATAPSTEHERYSTPERSHGSSSGGGLSIIYHPSDNSTSFESSLEALRISSAAEVDQESSIEFILTPPRAPLAPGITAVDDSLSFPGLASLLPHTPCATPSDASQPSEETSVHGPVRPSPGPTVLNPLVPPFRSAVVSQTDNPQPRATRTVLACFHLIIKDGKNMIGELRLDAKAALADLGLKPIPSLHGSALLPYARNPSGVDSFRFSVDEKDEAFSPVDDHFGARARPGPLPLPGNARYTYAGRLAEQRNSSAPAALGISVAKPVTTSSATPKKNNTKTPRRRGQGHGESAAPSPPAASVPQQQQPESLIPDQVLRAAPEPSAVQAAQEAALAQQRRNFLQQAQQVQLAQQAELESLRAQLASAINLGQISTSQLAQNDITTGIAPNFAFPSLNRPQQYFQQQPAQQPPISPTFPSFTSMPFSPTAPIDSLPRRNDGYAEMVDSLAVLQLAARQRANAMAFSPTSPLSSTFSSMIGTPPVPAVPAEWLSFADTAVPTSAQAGQPSASQPAQKSSSSSSGRRAHKRNTSDIGTAKEPYVEQGRRKSTAPSFPMRNPGRRSSIPPSIKVSPASPATKRSVAQSDSAKSGGEEAAVQEAPVPEPLAPPAGASLPPRKVGKAASQANLRRAFTDIGNRTTAEHVPSPIVEQRRASEPALSTTASIPIPLPETTLPTAGAAAASKQPKKGGSSRRKSGHEQSTSANVSRLSPVGEVSEAASGASSTSAAAEAPPAKSSKGKRRFKRGGKGRNSAPSTVEPAS